jgi:hypothetical protein
MSTLPARIARGVEPLRIKVKASRPQPWGAIKPGGRGSTRIDTLHPEIGARRAAQQRRKAGRSPGKTVSFGNGFSSGDDQAR